MNHDTEHIDRAADDAATELLASENAARRVFCAILLSDATGQLKGRTTAQVIGELEDARDIIGDGEGWDACLQGLADTIEYASWQAGICMDRWMAAVTFANAGKYDHAYEHILAIEEHMSRSMFYEEGVSNWPWRKINDLIGRG